MRILVTGADGFIAQNLRVRLAELKNYEVLPVVRSTSEQQLLKAARNADWVIHLAGVNRPKHEQEFVAGNLDFTRSLCAALVASGRRIPVFCASSTQAALENPYGRSKRAAEEVLSQYGRDTGASVFIARLPNVFGKWCRPNYNSVVATFCHNLARDLPIQINDPTVELTLVYVDDVVSKIVALLQGSSLSGEASVRIEPEYRISLGDLAEQLRAFRNCRTTLMIERVGTGLTRALYATYVSYLPVQEFVYDIPSYPDPRGTFAEMLKTPDCGQFSFFTAAPGITRGGHYHHSKTEKFLVIQSEAHFRFRHLITGELYELHTSAAKPQIVESIPGWAHDITNVGSQEMIVMLWANEVFDRAQPDTVAKRL